MLISGSLLIEFEIHSLSKFDEPDMQDTAGEAGTSS